eukprot:1141622-Pelagomonas_calceolata.AAC.2
MLRKTGKVSVAYLILGSILQVRYAALSCGVCGVQPGKLPLGVPRGGHVVLQVCLALDGLQRTLVVGAGAVSVCGAARGRQVGIGMVAVEMLSRLGCCFGSAVNVVVKHGGQGIWTSASSSRHMVGEYCLALRFLQGAMAAGEAAAVSAPSGGGQEGVLFQECGQCSRGAAICLALRFLQGAMAAGVGAAVSAPAGGGQACAIMMVIKVLRRKMCCSWNAAGEQGGQVK